MLEQAERSSIGRTLISVVIVLLVLSQAIQHLPDSALRRELVTDAQRLVRVTGTDVSWGVFAPNPRSVSIGIEAHITRADGDEATWQLPDGPIVGANLRYYRWRKWLERVRADAYDDLWEPTAAWLADIHDQPGNPVTRVELVRRSHENAVTGPQPEWEEQVFFTLDRTDGGEETEPDGADGDDVTGGEGEP